MRIIAGEHKGRKLKSVSGTATRPTSDKIKEAVFHKMGPFFSGGSGLDLFAGSGSLGLEALSRGMDDMVFVDQAKKAIQTIRQNVEALHVSEQSSIYRNDAFRAMEKLQHEGKSFQLILLDPPYQRMDYTKLLHTLDTYNLLAPGGMLYIEHNPEEALPIPDDCEELFFRKYNETTAITIIERVEE